MAHFLKKIKHKFAGVSATEQARRDRNKAAAAKLTRDMLYDERTNTFRGPAEQAARHPFYGGGGHDLNDVAAAVVAVGDVAEKHARDPARQNDTIDKHISVGLAQFQNEAEKLRLRRTRQGGRGNYAAARPARRRRRRAEAGGWSGALRRTARRRRRGRSRPALCLPQQAPRRWNTMWTMRVLHDHGRRCGGWSEGK